MVVLEKRGMGRPKGTFREPKRYEYRDRILRMGFSSYASAKLCGLTDRRGFWYYLKKTKQVEVWEQSCNQVQRNRSVYEKERKKELSSILGMAISYIYSNASDAEKKTFEYFQSRPRSYYNRETIETLLTRRFAAEEAGEKLSHKQLTEGLDISVMGSSRVFDSVDIETMYRKRGKAKHKRAK